MGHYDSCYEDDRLRSIERHDQETKERLLKKVEELSPEDRDFIMFICDDLEDVKAHFRIIKKKIK